MASNTIPQSLNHDFGFYGTICHHCEPQAAWNLAITAISDATAQPLEAVRAFLDSTHGRHFADHVYGRLTDNEQDNGAAIAATVADWMGWRISRLTARRYGIPAGFPYLADFVIHAEIEADIAG